MERRISQLLLLILLVSLMVFGSCPNASAAARKLLTQEEESSASVQGQDQDVEQGGSPIPSASVQGQDQDVAQGGSPSPSESAKTITFFLHQIVGGPNLNAQPLSGSSSFGGVGLVNPLGGVGIGNINGGIGNINGPLPLTIPAGALPNSPILPLPGNGVGFGVGVGSVRGGLFPLPSNGVVTPGLGLSNNIVPGSSSSFGFQNSGQPLAFPSTNINGPLQNPLLGASGVPLPNANANAIGLKNVIEIEGPLTEGPDLHSAQIGIAKGYYIMPTSSDVAAEGDDTLLLSFTAKFEGGGSEYEGSSIEFWGKEKSGTEEREIAVVGGSGVFDNAEGLAIIHNVSNTPLETTLEFTVNLTHY